MKKIILLCLFLNVGNVFANDGIENKAVINQEILYAHNNLFRIETDFRIKLIASRSSNIKLDSDQLISDTFLKKTAVYESIHKSMAKCVLAMHPQENGKLCLLWAEAAAHATDGRLSVVLNNNDSALKIRENIMRELLIEIRWGYNLIQK